MNKKKITLHIILLLLLSMMLIDTYFAKSVWSLDENQTIPTRTPIPPPPTATQSGGGTIPTATNTPPPQASPTSTLLPVNIAPTPVGGFLPTAEPCSGNPTIETLGATNVRSGPGLEYDVIGQLVYLEVRYIVGRAETAEWWLIQFNNGQFGWVADEIVLVQGYTPIVPIVEAPPLNGSTPTPGPAWSPTPIPFCTVTPVPTDTPTATAATTSSASASVEQIPTKTPTPTQPAPTEVRPTDTPIVQPTAVPPIPTEPVATAVSTAPTEESGGSGILLVGVGVILALGLGAFFLRRR
jgi:hypothetical protein